MKNFLLSIIAFAMLSTAASAADLDVAPEPILDNWAGWYAGINGGYGFANDPGVSWLRDGDRLVPAATAQPLVTEQIAVQQVLLEQEIVQSLRGNGLDRRMGNSSWDTDASGFFGGGQVGYNWQDDIYVYGVEGDFQFSDIKGGDGYYDFYESDNIPCATACLPVPASGHEQLDRVTQKLKWFATLRGRAGVSANENLLFYATAGLAFGQVKNKAHGFYEAFGVHYQAPNTSYSGASSKTKVGWTAGFGSELKITENVSFKVEYLYLDLGKTTVKSDVEYSEGPIVFILPPPNIRHRHKFKNQFHTVKAGLNWGF